MNGLTCNLHLMLVAFYVPTPTRTKIIMEAKVCAAATVTPAHFTAHLHPPQAFPSDRYAVRSQVQLRGLCPEDCIVEVAPREGEQVRARSLLHVHVPLVTCRTQTLRPQDILDAIALHAPQLACVMFRSHTRRKTTNLKPQTSNRKPSSKQQCHSALGRIAPSMALHAHLTHVTRVTHARDTHHTRT